MFLWRVSTEAINCAADCFCHQLKGQRRLIASTGAQISRRCQPKKLGVDKQKVSFYLFLPPFPSFL